MNGSDQQPVLIAQVPRAGGRWGQLHLNEAVVREFLGVNFDAGDRGPLVLRHRIGSGILRPPESRPLVYSDISNRNLKIELGAARGRAYPEDGRPVVVFASRPAEGFEYVLLMPGDAGYPEMLYMTQTSPRRGRGLPRIMTTLTKVRHAWPGCPLHPS